MLSLPPEESALLQVLHVAFAINVDSFGLPLGCLSLSSFYNKLICMMLFPVILCLLLVLGCVIGTGLIARILKWVARMLRELSRLGSKRMPPVDEEEEEEEEEEEASRPSAKPATRCILAAPYVLEALTIPMLQPYRIHPATLSHPGPFGDGRSRRGRRRA